MHLDHQYNSVNSSFNVSYQTFTYVNKLQNHLIEFDYTNIVQVIRVGWGGQRGGLLVETMNTFASTYVNLLPNRIKRSVVWTTAGHYIVMTDTLYALKHAS